MESGHAALDMVRAANADGERALAERDLPAAARAFTAALDHLGDLDGADETSRDLAATGHLGLGRVHLAGNDIRAADLRFDRVQRLRPTWPEGFYWAGCAAAHQAGYPRAEWLLSAALDRDGKHGKAYLQRAYVRLRLRQLDQALPDLLAAADNDAADDNARLLLAALLVRQGDAEQAVAVAAEVSTEVSAGAAAAAVLGMARYRQGRIDAAAAEFERAIAAGCHDDAVLLHHGLAGFRRTDFTASIAAWQRLRDAHPHHDTFRALVTAARHAGAVKGLADKDVAAALECLPDAGSAPAELATVVEVTQLHDAALAIEHGEWQRADTRLRTGGHRGLRYLAALEFRAGRHAAAGQRWRQAPADPVTRFGLAINALRNAEPAEAELRDLCTDPEAPPGIRGAAGRTLAALDIRNADWATAMETLDSLDVDWPAVRAEGRYRTGHPGEADDPWRSVADTEPADAWGRAGREHMLLRCADGLAAARRGDWATAAATLPDRTDDLADKPAGGVALVKAVACVLTGRRADAAAHLARAAARTPADHRIAHAQAVLHLHTHSAAEQPPPDDAGWRDCIGAWLSVLHDQDFWTRRRERAQQRYGTAVSEDMIGATETALDELIEERLPTDELALLLRRERAAATLLARRGGLPDTDPDGALLVCGPLRIAELRLHQRLGEHLRAMLATDDDTMELFRQFSELGLAQAQLAAGRPRAAARVALDLRCPSCARTGGRTHPAMISEPLLCEPDCPEFDLRNPAFATFTDKHDELATASAALAAETLLGIARGDITKAEMDLADARTCWRGAITLTNRFSRRDAVLHEVVDGALGRAGVLSHRGDLTGAITVLDAVLVTIPTRDEAERERVTIELGRLLSARGVRAFNETANAEQALADLRRAVAVSPDQPLPRFNLGVLLCEMSRHSYRRFDLAECIRLLGDAVEQFEIGATSHGTEKFQRELAQTRDELARRLDEYRAQPPDAEA